MLYQLISLLIMPRLNLKKYSEKNGLKSAATKKPSFKAMKLYTTTMMFPLPRPNTRQR